MHNQQLRERFKTCNFTRKNSSWIAIGKTFLLLISISLKKTNLPKDKTFLTKRRKYLSVCSDDLANRWIAGLSFSCFSKVLIYFLEGSDPPPPGHIKIFSRTKLYMARTHQEQNPHPSRMSRGMATCITNTSNLNTVYFYID